jgi:hypothetical protein
MGILSHRFTDGRDELIGENLCSSVAIFIHWWIVGRSKRAVVQLGRTLEWGSRGRGFESRQPDKIFSPRINTDETQIVHGEDPHLLV